MPPTDVTVALAIANFIILLAAIIGGYFSIRVAVNKTSQEVQSRVREALKDENELLQSRVKRLEEENQRMNGVLETIIEIFARRGTTIEIDGDMVQVRDSGGNTTSARRKKSP